VKLRKKVHGLLVAVFEICVSFIFCLSVPINGLKLLFVLLLLLLLSSSSSLLEVVVVVVVVAMVVVCLQKSLELTGLMWGVRGGYCPPAQMLFLTKISFLLATELKRGK
jgi:hypothetical protein